MHSETLKLISSYFLRHM